MVQEEEENVEKRDKDELTPGRERRRHGKLTSSSTKRSEISEMHFYTDVITSLTGLI